MKKRIHARHHKSTDTIKSNRIWIRCPACGHNKQEKFNICLYFIECAIINTWKWFGDEKSKVMDVMHTTEVNSDLHHTCRKCGVAIKTVYNIKTTCEDTVV